MNNENNTDNLERLYREQPPIEPPAGLDRIIRAQAEQAIERDKGFRPKPWMGGLATTAVLVLVVTVLVQTPPPTAELPAIESTRIEAQDLDAAKANPEDVALSAPASAAPTPSAPTRQQQNVMRQSSGASPASDSIVESREQLAVPRAERSRRSESDDLSFADQVVEEELEAMEPEPVMERAVLLDQAEMPDEASWDALEAAIEDEDVELATELLEALRVAFPDDARLEELELRVEELIDDE